MAGREIIFQSPHLTVVHAERGTRTVFVTFNELGMRANGDRFWGDELFDRVGISAIGFVSARPNWYPMIDMIQALDVAKARIDGRRVVTYGHSQGGYGALKFGAQLSASLALGFSPQWSINPDDVAGIDIRFMAHYDRLLRNGERIEPDDLCPNNLIFIDRAETLDAINGDRLLALDRVSLVPVPFTAHGTIRLITEGRKGRALIQRCTEDTVPTAAELRRMLRSARPRSRLYAEEKVRQLARTHRRHGRFLDAALQAIPEGPAKTMTVIAVDIVKGNLDAAGAELSAMTDDDILEVHFGQYWTAYRESGFLYGEQRIGPLYRHRYKDDMFQRLHGVNSLIMTGVEDLALEEMEILTRMTGAPQFLGHILGFYRQLNRLDLAAAFADTLARDESLVLSERIRIGFDLATAYEQRQLRPLLFRELQKLSELCRNDIDATLRIVEMFIGIGEVTFARQTLRLAQVPPSHQNLVDATLAQITATTDRYGAGDEVRRLLGLRSNDLRFWTKLSYLADTLVGCQAAIDATRAALALSPPDPVPLIHRLAWLLVAAGDRSAAIKQLRLLLASDMAATPRAKAYAELAMRCDKPDLAVSFAAKWLAAQPASADAAMAHLGYSLAVSKRDAAALEGIIASLHFGRLALSRDQYATLIDHARGLGYGLERQASQLAVKAYPADPQFVAATAQSEFAMKFLGPVESDGVQAIKAPRRRGLLGMLGGTRRA